MFLDDLVGHNRQSSHTRNLSLLCRPHATASWVAIAPFIQRKHMCVQCSAWSIDFDSTPNRELKRFRISHFLVLATFGLLALSVSACVVVAHRVDIQPVLRRDSNVIKTPVKVHLTDGSTGVYETGVDISAGMLQGKGFYYDIALRPFPTNPVLTPVPLDAIAALETYQERVDKGRTSALLPVSILGSAATVGAGAGSGTVEAGTILDKFPLAHGPQGVIVRITTDRRSLAGELIAVQNDGIIVSGSVMVGSMAGQRRIVKLDQKLRLFPYNTIDASDFEKASLRNAIKKRRTPSSEVHARLRLLSRFPQGLSPTLLKQLLRVHGQTALAQAR